MLTKRGKSQRQIAKELAISRTTVARVLGEPVERVPARRSRSSLAEPFAAQIKEWLGAGLSIVRMTELARADEDHPYGGGRSVFSDDVRRVREAQERESTDVAIRFEGLPGEYLPVDWGEIRHFPFTTQKTATRYFLACRPKYGRWSWVRWTDDMRQETLLRGLVACFCALTFVPWVLTFDNMKTVTSGRDPHNQPIWTPALLHLAASFDFHPDACAVRAPNQKGSVDSLVRWVKGNFLPGRSFADDADLAQQTSEWLASVNARPNAATHEPPDQRLWAEVAKGGPLPPEAGDFALHESGQVTDESVVHFAGNVYSVPLGHRGVSVSVRVHAERIRIFHDTCLLADHPRAAQGAHRRVIDPRHFQDAFAQKGRAQVMLSRQALLELDPIAQSYVSEVARRRRDSLRAEILGLYRLLEDQGKERLIRAMAEAQKTGAFGAEYVGALVREADAAALPERCPTLVVPGVPPQAEVDRLLSSYEEFVEGARALVGGRVR